VVIVEQDIGLAQRVSQRVVCLQEGGVSLEGRSGELTREQIAGGNFRPEQTPSAAMIDTLLQGLLLGGLCCLFALGQLLMFGVMRLTNTAQGDFIVLGAFAAIAAEIGRASCRERV